MTTATTNLVVIAPKPAAVSHVLYFSVDNHSCRVLFSVYHDSFCVATLLNSLVLFGPLQSQVHLLYTQPQLHIYALDCNKCYPPQAENK